MKVLQVNAVYKRFSTGRSVMELNEDLNKLGVESYCACSRTYGCDDVYRIGNELTIKSHAFMSRITGKQGYFSKSNTRKLIAHIEKTKPDIVHLHNLHANYINLPMILDYLAKKDIPTVISLYDCWFFTGKCMHYTELGCYKWEHGCKNCPQIHEGNDSWIFDRTNKVYNDKVRLFNSIPRLAIIGISDWITNECRRSAISRNAKIIQREYLWIDTAKFKPTVSDKRQKLGIEDKFVIVGVAEQWGAAKGLDRFLKLASQLSDDEVIILVGNPDADIQLPKNIISIGHTDSSEELAEYYSLADVFVTFSYQESFGKVSAEALSCGTPIICYNSTANSELAGDGCGVAVEINDKDGIINAVKEIRRNTKAFYTEKCVEFANENFSRDIIIARYKELYENLLK